MDTTNKRDSQRIAAAGSILEFCKIVAFDLNFNTDDIYWTTDYTKKNNRHVLTLITATEGLHTVIELNDDELIAYSQCIGAERIRDKIRKELLLYKALPSQNLLTTSML